MTEQQRNLEIADRLCHDFAWEGRTFREGQCIALLDGQIVAVGEDPAEVIAALRSLDPDPRRGMVVEVKRPAVDVIRGS